MSDRTTEKEYKSRVDSVVDFILKNMDRDISLQTLSGVANYSPFHLQKVFKQVTGENPKQYIVKLRLETALHSMVVYPHKSIHEIAMDCGFSSPAVFSRAIKSHYGVSPREIRSLKPGEGTHLLKRLHPENAGAYPAGMEKEIPVRVVQRTCVRGVYLLAPLNDPAKIRQAFCDVVRLAQANDLCSEGPEIFGILDLHQDTVYKAFVAVDAARDIPGKLNVTEIHAGKYAAFSVSGDAKETRKGAHAFFHHWLAASGYRLTGTTGFELFSGDPLAVDYTKLEREVFLPIQPA